MSIHHLKINRKPFEDLVSGRKTCEVRDCSDRQFKEGDLVELFLMDETGNPANKSIVRAITHIQRGYGLPDDLCVLSYAAPAVERQEPIGYVHQWELDRIAKKQVHWATFWNSNGSGNSSRSDDSVPLYTSPPAPVAVVLPTLNDFAGTVESIWGFGPDKLYLLNGEDLKQLWLGCLDKVKEMNK